MDRQNQEAVRHRNIMFRNSELALSLLYRTALVPEVSAEYLLHEPELSLLLDRSI